MNKNIIYTIFILLLTIGFVSPINIGEKEGESGVDIVTTLEKIGSNTFINLLDTPSTYVGNDGKCVVVDSTSGRLIFDDCNNDDIDHWNVSGNNLYPSNLNYEVGIGTDSPAYPLEVEGETFTDNLTVGHDAKILNDLDMTNGSINNIWELVSYDGSRIATGNNPAYSIFSGLDSAEVFSNNQTIEAGVITHTLLATEPGNEKVIAAWQSGKNDSGQYTRNSAGFFPDLGLKNVSILTNTEQMWFNFGITPLGDYFSTENRTAVASLYAFESQKLFLHDDIGQGELLGEGLFQWVLRDGEHFNILEGDVHISDESIKEFGFLLGANITIFFEDFETATLDKFTLITSGKGLDEWAVDASTIGDCPTVSESLICIHAGPGGGDGDTTIQTNFTTIDLSLNNLSFFINTEDMSFGGDFEVTMNNNVGSGDISIYSTTTNVLDQQIITSILSSMDDQIQVTMEFIFSSSHPNRGNIWVDHVIINATTTSSSLQNISVQQGRIEFGDGSCFISQEVIDEDLNQEMNITCDSINLIGNVTSTSVTEVSINVTEDVTIGGDLTISSLTEGSVLFAGADGLVSEDNAELFYDDVNGKLGIGTDSPQNKLDVSGAQVIGSSYAGVNTAPADGLLVEGNIQTDDRFFLGNGASIGYNATCAFIFYNQTGSIIETKGCT